jgi:hypothetical protein
MNFSPMSVYLSNELTRDGGVPKPALVGLCALINRVKMARRRKSGPSNAVARAVSAVGGPTRAARLCGVSNAAVHYWINRGEIISLKPALRLSRATGIPIEEFANDDED